MPFYLSFIEFLYLQVAQSTVVNHYLSVLVILLVILIHIFILTTKLDNKVPWNFPLFNNFTLFSVIIKANTILITRFVFWSF